VLLAWAFEMTPEGVKLEKDVDRSQSITSRTGRKLDYTIIAVLVVALGISVYLNVDEEDDASVDPAAVAIAGEDTVRPSIAILPFANRSANENDAFFVDGMHDDLLTQLAKISAFKVISRTSVLQYRNTEKPMPLIGEELGVTTIVEGGVQRAGDRIRINIQLIDAASDEHIWAETYNRELTAANIFEIQEEITAEIARALHAELSPEDQLRIAEIPTDNLAAYEAYLFGRQLINTRLGDDAFDAEAQFKHAIKLDPGFELAHVALGETYMIQNNLGLVSKAELLLKLDEFSTWANDLDGKSGEVYNVLAGKHEYEGNYVRAKEFYEKAVELSPQYMLAKHWLALFYSNFTGQMDEAIQIYQDVLKVDPLNETVRANLSFIYIRNGDFEAAQAEIRKGLALNGARVQTIKTLGDVYYYSFSDAATAMRLYQKASQMDSGWFGSPASLYGALGDSESAARWLQPHREKYPNEAFGVATELNEKLRVDDTVGVVELALEALTMSRDIMPAVVPLRALQDQYLRQDRADELLQMFSEYYPELLYEEPDVNQSNVEAALNLISVHRHMTDDVAAKQLSDIILKKSKIWPTVGIFGPVAVSAEVHALNGRTKAATAEISRLVDAGWIIYGADLMFGGDGMAELRADAEFAKLIEDNNVKVAAQLEQIRALEESGAIASYPEQLPIINIDVSSLLE
jgi:TolB-like protein